MNPKEIQKKYGKDVCAHYEGSHRHDFTWCEKWHYCPEEKDCYSCFDWELDKDKEMEIKER